MDLQDIVYSSTFFDPNKEFVNWIKDYANGRIIFDIGCGNGHFLKELKRAGHHKLIGIDPHVPLAHLQKSVISEFGSMIQFLPFRIKDDFVATLLKGLTSDKILCTICRPCHHYELTLGSYEVCKELGIELLYIGVDRNFEMDLTDNDIPYEIIEHSGSSKDYEKVLKLN